MFEFPEGFLWGAATAAHQVEGNNVNSDWWAREHGADPAVAEPSGDAADHYHRYPEDMRLLADAGLTAYRFSIEWARIEPERGHVSRAALDHYRRMIATARDLGLNPTVTLIHFTVPRWFRREGFWWGPHAAERFASYVEAVLPILDEVEHVCTINEPNIAAMLAGGEDAANLVAHGLPNPDPLVADALLDAHRRAREILAAQGQLRSGWTIATQAFHSTGEPGADEMLHEYGHPRDFWYLENSAGDDFVGVQAYTRTFIGPDGPLPVADDVETTLTGWEFFPPALELGVRSAWKLTGGVPVFVTENGIATADDTRRIAYTRGALEGLHAAIADGVEVIGYEHWSALDNYEWASGYRPTFGLIGWDPVTFERHPKPSLAWLGEIARRNTLDNPTTAD